MKILTEVLFYLAVLAVFIYLLQYMLPFLALLALLSLAGGSGSGKRKRVSRKNGHPKKLRIRRRRKW